MGSPVALPQITSLTLKIATFLVQNPAHGRIYVNLGEGTNVLSSVVSAYEL